jgi:hypothetical protein
VSLGSVREFVMKHRATKESLVYRLRHGSLLVMGGSSQHYWLHSVPKVKGEVGPRISLTFRKSVGAAQSGSCGRQQFDQPHRVVPR